jgi:hypothetical protein
LVLLDLEAGHISALQRRELERREQTLAAMESVASGKTDTSFVTE